MKIQKRFLICNRFKCHTVLGIFFILAALFASGTQAAETRSLDPGIPGEGAKNFDFGLTELGQLLVVFEDNKTIKWTAGTHIWRVPGYPNCRFVGVFLDESLQQVPTALFVGKTASGGIDYSPALATATLEQDGVFRGMLFTAITSSVGACDFDWQWDPNDQPLVGQLDASGNQPPIAEAGEPVAGAAGAQVAFNGTASIDPDGIIFQYDWDFGDGNTGTGLALTHIYAGSGLYNVTLTVTDSLGASDSDTTTATIGEAPPPTVNAGCSCPAKLGERVDFYAEILAGAAYPLQYNWDFGDGETSTDDAPSHTYASSGDYTAIVTVTDVNGATGSDTTTVTITESNQAPVANAGPPVVGAAGAQVAFNGCGSSDPDGGIVRYDWEFGDGKRSDNTSCSLSHQYTGDGVFTVILTVKDQEGASDSDTTTASISQVDQAPLPPSADAGGPYSSTEGVSITFHGDGSEDPDGGKIKSYSWDFGDGGTSTFVEPAHEYTSAGVYDVVLTVTDDEGVSASDATTAQIAAGKQPPVADPGPPMMGKVGEPITFDGSASFDPDGGVIQSYRWYFGDGSDFSFEVAPSHTYTAPGEYTATLEVVDDEGVFDNNYTTVSVDANNVPPVSDTGGPYTGAVGSPVNFDGSASDDSDGSIVSYDWNFGDGGTGTGESPTHTYTVAGTYDVSLTVLDDGGSSNQSWTTAAIDLANVPPVADAGGPYGGKVEVLVDFDGSASDDSDGSIVLYDWNFGDGNTGTGATPSNTYAATGVYDVELTVTDNAGVTAKSATRAVIGDGVNLPPTADAGGPYAGDAGVIVAFDGSGSSDPDGGIVQYDWDFGDDNTAIDGGPTPVNTYAAAGMYLVTLTVTDDGGTTNTTITVTAIGQDNQSPSADAGGPYAGAAGAVPVLLDGTGSSDADGTIVQSEWDFGDGGTASELWAIHTYAAAGAYTATLTVTDDDGGTDQSTATVTIGDGSKLPPTADANGPYNGVADTPVTFDGTASDDPDGDITAFDWAFGDDQTESGPTPNNTYLSGGLYNVILQVKNNDGLIDSDNTLAHIGDFSLPPTADANGPYKGRVDAPLSFDGTSSNDPDGDIVQYDWDFGDGSDALIDAGPTLTHTYSADGEYNVKLTVTDDSGETDVDVTKATVGIGNLPPNADAGGSYVGTVSLPVTFNGAASEDPDGTIEAYEWYFGDGNTGTEATPNYTYTKAGNYIVTLKVTDNSGKIDWSGAFTVINPAEGTTSPLYRFWSDQNFTHFYTISEQEKETIENTYPEEVWRYETIAYYAYPPGAEPVGSSPVYRFWSDQNQAHFYTISEEERDDILNTYPEEVWRYETIAYYAYPPGAEPIGSSPVYRFWSDTYFTHFYTISEEEKDDIIANYPEEIWRYETIAWYAYTTAEPQ